jgi:hypothetical protein
LLLRLKCHVSLRECSQNNCAHTQPSRDLYARHSGDQNLVLTYLMYKYSLYLAKSVSENKVFIA